MQRIDDLFNKVKFGFKLNGDHCLIGKEILQSYSGVSLTSCRLQQELHRVTRPHLDRDGVSRVYSEDSGTRKLYHCTLFHEFSPTKKRTVLGIFSRGGHKTIS